MKSLAPIAAVGVVLVTLLAALPVYWYVVGRSPHGKGGIGLLEQRAHGWRGKLLVLILLGFVATDFVLTRSLSVSDASTHLLANPGYQSSVSWVVNVLDADANAWVMINMMTSTSAVATIISTSVNAARLRRW